MMRDPLPNLKALATVQQYGAQGAAEGVCGKIIPSRAAPRQVHLVPFIHCAHSHGAAKRHCVHHPATKAACKAKGGGKHRKHQGMQQFVPRWRDQAYSNELRTANEQAKRQANRQRNGSPLHTSPQTTP